MIPESKANRNRRSISTFQNSTYTNKKDSNGMIPREVNKIPPNYNYYNDSMYINSQEQDFSKLMISPVYANSPSYQCIGIENQQENPKSQRALPPNYSELSFYSFPQNNKSNDKDDKEEIKKDNLYISNLVQNGDFKHSILNDWDIQQRVVRSDLDLIPLDEEKIKIIAHTGKYSACLQPTLNKKAYLVQKIDILKDRDFLNFNFWGARLDIQGEKKLSSTFKLKTSVYILPGDKIEEIIEAIKYNKKLDLDSSLIKIEILPGIANQLQIDNYTKKVCNYNFVYYAKEIAFDRSINYFNEVTIVFIAEAIKDDIEDEELKEDPILRWYIDDVYLG